MARGYLNVPPGIEILHSFRGRKYGYAWYKGSVLALTFLCYMAFHATRKPASIVKSVLNGDRNATIVSIHKRLLQESISVSTETKPDPNTGGWFPFNGPNGQSLLGEVDLAFLGAYAIGMFFAGHLGDRLDLRYFLATGMIGSGIFVSLFGMAFFWDIHYLSYFFVVQIIAGLFQSTGWPSVVSIMANWFGKGKRGLIMGVWNAHTSVGNILGTVIAASWVASGWGWSFIWPGVLIIVLGFLILGFLVVQPSDIGLPSPYGNVPSEDEKEEVSSIQQHEKPNSQAHHESIHFMDAWRIPGVSAFALCLFFSKLIAYVFLYWLPYYIKKTPIENRLLTPKEAGDLSILFDVGGVLGGILAGHLSDKSGASALVAVGFTLCSVPMLYLYRVYGHLTFGINIALMMLSGFFVNGPYALITTAVSADLGTHESLNGNAKALATVTAIIDGMGSIGAAIGPALTGYISDNGGFDMVFAMLYLSAFIAAALLFNLASKEFRTLQESRKTIYRVTNPPTYQPVINVKI